MGGPDDRAIQSRIRGRNAEFKNVESPRATGGGEVVDVTIARDKIPDERGTMFDRRTAEGVLEPW